MKKRTLSKLKSIFGSKKGKRHHQESLKSSRSPSPEPSGEAHSDSFRPIAVTPPPCRVGPPPSPPVPTHPIAPVPPLPAGPLPLLPCAVCGRTFLPQSLAKHIKICEKMQVKKRKTFDSSRQRREGTDLEQYLPKNFGLPDNSPFLEKSPPHTAKTPAKPKSTSVKSAITKPMAELQRCPHCNRAFGMRAFERHVEWCADKARILPAAPAQPPQHLADAKQRLNARTQYKAPLARGRRSSQSRDKSSNSRSASVESSRGVSPPPPREYGDYKHGRARLPSESTSSIGDHDDISPHVPVIRNTRNSLKNNSGDANVKARQARLAKDLNSSSVQEIQPPPIQQSKTDPNIKKIAPQNKLKNALSLKKQQQIKKLEEIANKYNERQQKHKEERLKYDRLASGNKNADKSQIPLPKKTVSRNKKRDIENTINRDIENKPEEDFKEIESPKRSSSKGKSRPLKVPSQISVREPANEHVNVKEKIIKSKVIKRDSINIKKESTMSLDSLEEERATSVGDKTRQSIGINTELLCPCVPCVIHDTIDPKTPRIMKVVTEKTGDITEPKVELLYQNLTLISSCDIQARTFNQEYNEDPISDYNRSMINPSTSELDCDRGESKGSSFQSKVNDSELISNDHIFVETNATESLGKQHKSVEDDKINKDGESDIADLSAENFDNDYNEPDNSEFEDSGDNNKNVDVTEANDIVCRHGSGETYTKFTENPDDLEEFMNLTDKMMSQNSIEERADLEKVIDEFHTPKTNSIEAINNHVSGNENSDDKHHFSDSLEELKCNLSDILKQAGDDALNKKEDSENSRKVCDMEHITMYQLKFYEQKIAKEIPPVMEEESLALKLPSIVENNKPKQQKCSKKRVQRIYKSNRKFKMLSEQKRGEQEHQTFIKDNLDENSDSQSIPAEEPPLKLPRIENKRIDDTYDPFLSAARQMKELMSSDTNVSKKIQISSKDPSRTLPILRTTKEKSTLSSDNTKMMKDSLNKTYQKTPTLQRMKSFGSTNNENANNSFGGRCSSFRLNRNEKKPSQKLNTTFNKCSKENISTTEKNYFNRNSSLNRSFSSYTASAYSTPKPKDKIPKIATSMYHSFQRSTIKQPVKLDKIKRDDEKKAFVNLGSILADDNSSMTDSNYIDPRLINENDNLPVNVNTILNNPDIISSMESLLTTENLPPKFDSFNGNTQNNNVQYNFVKESQHKISNKIENNNNLNNNITAPILDDLSVQYDKIMSSLEHSIASKTSIRDDDSLCEDFDLEEFMTSFDEEIHKQKMENKRSCSSTTRVVKPAELADSNRTSELNSMTSSPKVAHNGSNGLIPVNKSMSLNFSSNNVVGENLFPSSVKRSTSLLDSIHKKNVQKTEYGQSRHKADLLEQDIMQSLKDFDKFYENEKIDNQPPKEVNYNTPVRQNGTAKREPRAKPERKSKKTENVSNGNPSNDSAYSSLNRISPSKLSVCNSKESNGVSSLEQIPAGSDSSGCAKDEVRSVSSEEFLAMERSAELDAPLQPPAQPYKEMDPVSSDKRASSRSSSRRSSTWRPQLSSSGSEASLHRPRRDSAPAPPPPRLSRFCHECGSKFPVDTAKFCIECGVRRLMV